MVFEGIYTPIITPFRADLTINYDELASLVDNLIKSGVNGIIAGGTTGEYYALSMSERCEIMTFVKSTIKGRVPLIAGVGAIRTEESIDLALHAKSIGADGLLVGSPFYAVPTERENAQHALAIDRAAGLPIMLYNYPGRTGTNMGSEFLDIVTESKNFCAIKESSGDINKLHRLVTRYPQLQLSCGADDQALEFFAWGATSWVCGGSNFLPTEHLALYETCAKRGDFSQGRAMMHALLPLLETLEQGGQFVQGIKYGCELSGCAAGPVRPPLQPASLDDRLALSATIEKVRQVMKGLMAP